MKSPCTDDHVDRSERTGWASRVLAIVVAVSVLPAIAAEAEPFVTQLEWIHPDPESLDHFEVLFAFSVEEQLAPTAVDVGLPLRSDRYVWGITVDDQTSLWVAVVAVDRADQRSPRSAWRRIDWRPGQGPLAEPGRPYLVDESGRE